MTPENVTITLPAELAHRLGKMSKAIGGLLGGPWSTHHDTSTSLLLCGESRLFWLTLDGDRQLNDLELADLNELGQSAADLLALALTATRNTEPDPSEQLVERVRDLAGCGDWRSVGNGLRLDTPERQIRIGLHATIERPAIRLYQADAGKQALERATLMRKLDHDLAELLAGILSGRLAVVRR